jgi:hypothetical protein
MFRFTTPRQAVEAFEAINADYERHCRAARKLAENHFDAKHAVRRILNHALNEMPTAEKQTEQPPSRTPSSAPSVGPGSSPD